MLHNMQSIIHKLSPSPSPSTRKNPEKSHKKPGFRLIWLKILPDFTLYKTKVFETIGLRRKSPVARVLCNVYARRIFRWKSTRSHGKRKFSGSVPWQRKQSPEMIALYGETIRNPKNRTVRNRKYHVKSCKGKRRVVNPIILYCEREEKHNG